MAYVLEDKELDEELQGSQPKQLGAESAIITDSPQPTQQSDTGSGQYVNLQSYLKSNQPRKFGQEVAGKIGERITGAEQAQKQAEEGFKSIVDKNATEYDENLVKQAVEKPEEVAGDEELFNRFTKQRTAQYQGPDNIVDTEYYQPAQRATREATEEADLSGDEYGRQTILDRYYGSGKGNAGYTAGQRNLDNLLISADEGSQSALEEQRNRAGNVGKGFQSLQEQLNQYAQGKKQSTQTAAQKAAELVGGAKSQEQEKINQKYQDTLAQRAAMIEREKQLAAQNKLSRNLAERLGLTPMRTYGVNLADYLQEGANPTIHEVVTPEERNRYQSLEKILGGQENYLPYGELAGKYNQNQSINLDKERMLNDINANKAKYEDLLNRQSWGYGTTVGGGDVSFSGGQRYIGSDPIFGEEGNYRMPRNSIQESLDYYKTPHGLAALGPEGDSSSTSRENRASYAALQKILQRAQDKYGYNKFLGIEG